MRHAEFPCLRLLVVFLSVALSAGLVSTIKPSSAADAEGAAQKGDPKAATEKKGAAKKTDEAKLDPTQQRLKAIEKQLEALGQQIEFLGRGTDKAEIAPLVER